MALARKLLHRRLYSLLEPQNVAFVYHIIHSNPPYYHKIPPSSHHRPFASSSQSPSESDQTHAIKSLHSIFEGRTERRSYPKNEKLRGKSKQGEAVGLSEKTGEKKKKKKLRKSRESKVKFFEEEEEVVKEELQGKPEQGEAVGLSEQTGDKKKKNKKKKKKLRKSRESKVIFVEEEEEEVVKEELQGKPEPGEAVGLSEKTGDKKKKKKKPQKKLRKSRESKVKFVEEEEEVVKEELQGKPEPGEAVGLSEKTGDKKKKKKKPQKKLRTSRESKVNFVEEEEEAVKEELQGKSEQGEAVSLSEKTEQEKSEVRCIEDKKKKPEKKLKKPGKWKVKFIEDEEEEEVVEGEQTKKPEPKRLYDLFSQGEKSKKANRRRLSHGIAPVETHKEMNQRKPVGLKKLSLDMEIFLSYLYKEGYFRDANFVKGKNFDLSRFDIKYARYYTLSAVQKFGKDKQEISKWLSGSDLKQVAMFGCPSDSKSQVFPSKRLRNYFKIPENTVCNKCVLRDSCKFVNQSVWRTDNNNLDLAVAMKVICSYAMSIVHPQLVVPDKVNSSVNRLLKEVLKLSQTF